MTDADTEPRKRQKTDADADVFLDGCFGVYPEDGVDADVEHRPSDRMDFLVSIKFKEFRISLKGPSTVTFTLSELVDRATRTFLEKGADADTPLEMAVGVEHRVEQPVILCLDEAFAKQAYRDAAKMEKALRYAVRELWFKDNVLNDVPVPVIRRLIADAFRVPGTLAPARDSHCDRAYSAVATVGITLKIWATPGLKDLVAAKKAAVKREKYIAAARPLADPATIAVIGTMDNIDNDDSRLLQYAPEGTRCYHVKAKVKVFGTHMLDSKGEIMWDTVRVNPHDIVWFEIMEAPAELKALGIDDDVAAAFKSQDGEMRAFRERYVSNFEEFYKAGGMGGERCYHGDGKSRMWFTVYVPSDVEARKAAQHAHAPA